MCPEDDDDHGDGDGDGDADGGGDGDGDADGGVDDDTNGGGVDTFGRVDVKTSLESISEEDGGSESEQKAQTPDLHTSPNIPALSEPNLEEKDDVAEGEQKDSSPPPLPPFNIEGEQKKEHAAPASRPALHISPSDGDEVKPPDTHADADAAGEFESGDEDDVPANKLREGPWQLKGTDLALASLVTQWDAAINRLPHTSSSFAAPTSISTQLAGMYVSPVMY